LKVRARAEQPGNHVFRAEVHCKPLGTRLVSEETTHFYTDKSGGQEKSETASSKPSSPSAGGTLRTTTGRPRTVELPLRNQPVEVPLR